MAKQQPRGLRNNNPLNIRHSANRWRGLSDSQTDSQFCQFRALRWGLRAAAVILRTYIKKYRCDTIAKIIARFAPTNENNTEAYISRVSDLTGIDRNKKLKFSDKTAICSILQAMSVVELGGRFITYTDCETGYGLANAENPY